MNAYNEITIINEIVKNKTHLEEIKEEINLKTYYMDLIFSEVIRNIKALSKCAKLSDECVSKAAQYVNDSNKYCDNVEYYNILKEILKKELFNDDIEIDRVFILGYDLNNYGYSFEILYNDYRFAIIIPDYRYITIDNYEYCNEGKYVLQVKKNESLWIVLDSSYTLSYLRPKLIEFLEKELTK